MKKNKPGRPTQDFTRKINAFVSMKTFNRLLKLSKALNISLSAAIRHAVDAGLK